ncbi:AFaDin (Actin filament binding protein), partial [Trichostrongylus colubriformis]
GEIPCDSDVIARIVGLAERQADHLTLQDGHPITLAESEQLLLPFLLPQDGYTAEQLRGVPDGLVQYLLSLQDKGLCHSVSVQESSLATWRASPLVNNTTVVQRPPVQTAPGPSPQLPLKSAVQRTPSQSTLTSLPTTHFGDSFGSMNEEVIRVVLKRGAGGIGLSIVAAQGVGDRQVGIYVKKVVAGSPAATDGRLAAGDQLLSVNGQSLLGISQEEAADFMARAGAEIRFDVRKGAALRNGLSTWLCQPTSTTAQPATSVQHQTQYAAPQQQQQHQHMQGSHASNYGNSPSNYAVLPAYGSQQSVQTTNSNYQRYQPAPGVRASAFAPVSGGAPVIGVEPNRHYRSVSASDLYQSDPNASYSQRSVAGSTTGVSGFDRLPSHYRHSNRPTVIQPGRPSATSPSALRRGAHSPVSLYRPPSATTLFAAPRSPNPLQQQGYVRAGSRDNLDQYRMNSPPAAHSSPREEHRVPPTTHTIQQSSASYSASLPSPLNRSTQANNSNYQQLPGARNIPTVRYLPRGPTSPTSLPNGNAAYGKPPAYSNPPVVRPLQEAAVVRPIELAMPKDEVNLRHRDERPRSTTTFGVMAPTAFTQALQAGGAHEARVVLNPPRHSGIDRELRNLERTNTALMSHDAVNEELDRLDAKGINMTEEETRRYRELLNAASEQTRRTEQRTAAVVAPTTFAVQKSNGDMSRSTGNRTETLIDDVDNSPGRSAMRENISPGDSHERKSVQFRETVSVKETEIMDSPSIYGTNEIYRDPRQQRLNELQERQETRVPDGLGFRDKMRMFATQLGEGTPKTRYSASSAERQIQEEQ